VAEAETLREQGFGRGANALLKQQVVVLKAHLEETAKARDAAAEAGRWQEQAAAAAERQAELAEQEVGRLRDTVYGLQGGGEASLGGASRGRRVEGAAGTTASSGWQSAGLWSGEVTPPSRGGNMQASLDRWMEATDVHPTERFGRANGGTPAARRPGCESMGGEVTLAWGAGTVLSGVHMS
jgi:hypothetical protein